MWITVPRTVTSGRVSSAVGVSVVTMAIGSLSPAKAVARNTATAWMNGETTMPRIMAGFRIAPTPPDHKKTPPGCVSTREGLEVCLSRAAPEGCPGVKP